MSKGTIPGRQIYGFRGLEVDHLPNYGLSTPPALGPVSLGPHLFTTETGLPVFPNFNMWGCMAIDPATRELVKGCIPALLVLIALAGAFIGALWWWLG
jgi:hypothetical protein